MEKQEKNPGQYCREVCKNESCGWCKNPATRFDHDQFCGDAKYRVTAKKETIKIQLIEL